MNEKFTTKHRRATITFTKVSNITEKHAWIFFEETYFIDDKEITRLSLYQDAERTDSDLWYHLPNKSSRFKLIRTRKTNK